MTRGSGLGLFCGGSCAVTMSGTWTEEGDAIRLRYSRPPMREIDATVWLKKNGDFLEGNLINNNRLMAVGTRPPCGLAKHHRKDNEVERNRAYAAVVALAGGLMVAY